MSDPETPLHFRARRVLELEWEFDDEDDTEATWLDENATFRHEGGFEFVLFLHQGQEASFAAKVAEMRAGGVGRLADAMVEARRREAEYLLVFHE